MTISLLRTLRRKESFLRYLENRLIAKLKISGEVIDLGAKVSDEKYYHVLDQSDISALTFCDIFSVSENVVKVNLEQRLEIESKRFDNVILFNVLEHIYNYRGLVGEMQRILKPDGAAHVIVPFLHRYHGDPADYNRPTHVALYRMFKEGGFDSVKVHPIGAGAWTVIASLLAMKLKSVWLQYPILTFFLWLQKQEDKIIGKKNIYSLAYYVEARKC